MDVGFDGKGEDSSIAAPYTIVVGEGPCQGDSGGPLLSAATGAAIGVYSILLSSTCKGPTVRNAYTQVASFESTIRDALEFAGQEPTLEPVITAGAGGMAGTGGTGGVPGTGGTGGDAAAPNQGGEAGGLGEGGAATGGTEASVGGGEMGGTGGSSATGGTGGKGGTGASPATGGTGATLSQGEGSGSRRDPACTCRTGASDRSPSSLVALLVGALGVALRRHRRRSAEGERHRVVA
jgi:MYXO-CTERM domain-containing protein